MVGSAKRMIDEQNENTVFNDDAEMLRQMRLLYCRSNRLVRLFSKCPY